MSSLPFIPGTRFTDTPEGHAALARARRLTDVCARARALPRQQDAAAVIDGVASARAHGLVLLAGGVAPGTVLASDVAAPRRRPPAAQQGPLRSRSPETLARRDAHLAALPRPVVSGVPGAGTSALAASHALGAGGTVAVLSVSVGAPPDGGEA